MLRKKLCGHLGNLFMHCLPINRGVVQTKRRTDLFPVRGALTQKGVMADLPRQDGQGSPWDPPSKALGIRGRRRDRVGLPHDKRHRYRYLCQPGGRQRPAKHWGNGKDRADTGITKRGVVTTSNSCTRGSTRVSRANCANIPGNSV